MIQSRIERLTMMLEKAGVDGVALNAGPSLTYFTGLDFHLMERPVVFLYLPRASPVLILPRLESAKVDDLEGVDCFYYDENPRQWPAVFCTALAHLGVSRQKMGIEPLGLRFLEYSILQQAVEEATFKDCSTLIATLRGKKDSTELALMQKAVDIAQDALGATLPLIRLGMEEKEIAAELVTQLFKHGSDTELPFSPIVSGGVNGANPHAKPSSRKICEGDLLVIDWGAACEGYVSDITRTFAVGTIDDESVRIHDLVQEANAAARRAGAAGTPCREVDRAARRVIKEAGYGDFFTHRTGHGIGMECHESPYIHEDNDLLLEVGMTFTVEPGIYLPGKNGVRIEDDVMVTEDGVVSLSDLPRRIVRVG